MIIKTEYITEIYTNVEPLLNEVVKHYRLGHPNILFYKIKEHRLAKARQTAIFFMKSEMMLKDKEIAELFLFSQPSCITRIMEKAIDDYSNYSNYRLVIDSIKATLFKKRT
jgi:hypothetical protein